MHLLEDPSAFVDKSISWTKENNGTGARQQRNRKSYYLCFVFSTFVTTSYLFFGGKYPNDNSLRIIPESASISIKQEKVDPTSTKDAKDIMKQEENINSMENDTEGRIIRFYTSNIEGVNRGSFTILTHPEWAPIGMKHFDALTDSSFWKGCRFFRVIDNFIAQFGVHGNPSVQEFWDGKVIKDDEGKIHEAHSCSLTQVKKICFWMQRVSHLLQRSSMVWMLWTGYIVVMVNLNQTVTVQLSGK